MTRPSDQPYEISSKRQIEALASPQRQELIDAVVSSGPCSIAEMARHLGRPADRLYFHVKLLERVGLLVRVESRVEGRQRTVIFDVPGRPLSLKYQPERSGQAKAVGSVVDGVLRLARRDFRKAISSGEACTEGAHRDTWGGRLRGWLTPAELRRANVLITELAELMREAKPRRGTRPIALTWVLTPLERATGTSKKETAS